MDTYVTAREFIFMCNNLNRFMFTCPILTFYTDNESLRSRIQLWDKILELTYKGSRIRTLSSKYEGF